MQLEPNRLKRSLGNGKRKVGYWLTLVSPTSAEIAASAGFDWLLIDMEHSTSEMGDVISQLRATEGGTAEPIVRVPWNDSVIVKRVLDAGARSILFPYIETAEEARAAVAATRYPPKGIRGFGGVTRATRYGRVPNYAANVDDDLCILLQVESPGALANIEEIGAVDGVDVVFIGPSDLAANMGFPGNSGAPEVKRAVLNGLAAIKRTGKAAATLNYRDADIPGLFEAGFELIAVGGDSTSLARETDRLAKTYR
jgi:4-hydroxy-2-oxoheptanedioate aldolase